jgi:outer membrane protein assembly factor BamB
VFSTPAVAGDLLLVGSCNSMVRGLDRRTGRVRWEYNTSPEAPASFHGDPLVVGDTFLIGTDGPGDDGIHAFDWVHGSLRWTAHAPLHDDGTPGVASDIQVVDGRVYATSLADELLCLDLADGRLLWSHRTEFRTRGRILNATPAIVGRVVVLGGRDGTAYGLEAREGKLLWKNRLGASITTSVCAADSGVVMGTEDGTLHLLDAETGAVQHRLELNKVPSGPIVEVNGRLLVCTDWLWRSSELVCVDSVLSRTVWRLHPPTGTVWSTPRPYVYDGRLFLGTTGGQVSEYAIEDGRWLRSTRLSGVIRGIRLADGILYVGSQAGTIHALRR